MRLVVAENQPTWVHAVQNGESFLTFVKQALAGTHRLPRVRSMKWLEAKDETPERQVQAGHIPAFAIAMSHITGDSERWRASAREYPFWLAPAARRCAHPERSCALLRERASPPEAWKQTRTVRFPSQRRVCAHGAFRVCFGPQLRTNGSPPCESAVRPRAREVDEQPLQPALIERDAAHGPGKMKGLTGC